MNRLYLTVLFAFILGATACGGGDSTAALRAATTPPTVVADDGSRLTTRPPATRRPITPTRPAQIDGLDTFALSELPEQVLDTLELIEEGGPFPYRQDGAVFQNRERLLSNKPRGYYQEYTVETPGSDDRGARRIVTGQNGELYYTDDHYDSFKVIIDDE